MLHLTVGQRERERGDRVGTHTSCWSWGLSDWLATGNDHLDADNLHYQADYEQQCRQRKGWGGGQRAEGKAKGGSDLICLCDGRECSATQHMWQATFICNMRPANVYSAAADECQCSSLCSLRCCCCCCCYCYCWGFASAKCLASCSASCLLVGVASTQQRDLTPTWICITKATQIARCSLCSSSSSRSISSCSSSQSSCARCVRRVEELPRQLSEY